MHPSLPIVAVKSIFWRDYVHKVVSYKSGVSDVVYVLFWFMFVCFVFFIIPLICGTCTKKSTIPSEWPFNTGSTVPSNIICIRTGQSHSISASIHALKNI